MKDVLFIALIDFLILAGLASIMIIILKIFGFYYSGASMFAGYLIGMWKEQILAWLYKNN